MASSPIDFDTSDSLKLFRAAYETAEEHQGVRDQQYERDYQNYHAFLDMALRNPDRSNVTIPKIRSIVHTKAPAEIKAAVGSRPYIPFKARRDEFGEFADSQSKVLDHHLELGGFFNRFVLSGMMKIVYGTAYMDALPYFKTEVRRVPIPIMTDTMFGPRIVDYRVQGIPIQLLRLKIKAWAPWEIKVDPHACGLENEGDCRYIIKIQITSKRQIKKEYEQGAYPGLDIDELEDIETTELSKNIGLQILSNMGMTEPRPDSDIGILFRYESPERYIDVWNDRVVLRDIPNPFDPMGAGHGLINLSRMIHDVDPHTQAQFFGNGEVKPNEILQSLLNDLYNIAIDNHNFANQGMTYYALGRGISDTANEMVRQVGNKVGFKLESHEKIDDVIKESFGQPLPADHYVLMQRTEDNMDLTAQSHEVMRGEQAQGDKTLGEINWLRQAGEAGQELNIRNVETFLADLGKKCLCHLDQFGRMIDREEVLGREEAIRLIMLNPRDLPGGYDFTFKGSDRVVNQLVRQRNLMLLDERVSRSPYLKEREWIEVLTDAHDLSEEFDKAFMTEEEFAFKRQQDLMAQLALGGTAGQGNQPQLPAPTNAGRVNTPQQVEGSMQ